MGLVGDEELGSTVDLNLRGDRAGLGVRPAGLLPHACAGTARGGRGGDPRVPSVAACDVCLSRPERLSELLLEMKMLGSAARALRYT